ncbi:MAG: hypothetical protein A2534_00250 [Candidatus Magasanikbacteria bacterium RIFOXYD2_FULL_39_9]|uniref:DUF5667 domain-containing protein n=1 Tax=Candidatus Magasanikbacteria bacterium RIFOXYD1_FULL_40_23 TaxID=1798705 RepID=A0A1F6P9P9_9BACT|nr:MAG: hypothetical protein A2534_00250 [Candidatus Magasanikbacteria bacterium RIFOXYD2_FULL_39_9]OGH92760.1 MAG: hypothetical protein A2563_03775 [Candidatus Magasanikbacteria bacterium RIFOXYD1_FULL_40_23]
MKKKNLIYASLSTLTVVGLLAAGTTYAASTNPVKYNQFNEISTAIAAKFNLNQVDVQSVINETVTLQHQKRTADILAEAVKNGKLTQAQADLITSKTKEIQTSLVDLKDMTPTDRAAAMKKTTEDLKQWTKDNNIPQQYVTLFGKQHFTGNFMGMKYKVKMSAPKLGR